MIVYGDGLHGDALLYYGLMTEVDPKQYQKIVSFCQDDSGRIWRNITSTDRGKNYVNACSRDMMAGFLLGAKREQVEALRAYLRKNKWLLCPTASDNRNRVGLLGRLEIEARVRGWRWPFYIIQAFAVLEIATAWKGYQMHLGLVALLRCRRQGLAGPLYKWGTFIAELRSSGNFLVAYMTKDTESLRRARMGLIDRGPCGYKDVWPAATFEPWRANRMAHPLALEFVNKAIALREE